MTAKEYLRQLQLLDIRIKQRCQQLEELKQKAVSIGCNTDNERVQTTSTGDKLLNSVAAYVDLEQSINNMMVMFEKRKDKLITQIQALEDPLYVDLLYRRYVECKRLEQISCDMGYSFEYIRHVHGDALEAFKKLHLNTQ